LCGVSPVWIILASVLAGVLMSRMKKERNNNP
jgi:hypothetical protein